ncbi:MAG TPA: Crp/Fnr family transcriptional regulator [Clostridia bacterium]|nr:Crp/Fnr family transcriptional regulator [Clostridia bacterium]
MEKKYYETFKSASLFSGIGGQALESLLNCLNPMIKSFHNQETIAVAGSRFSGIGVVLEGKASIFKENFAGDRVLIDQVQPGEMFGEMAAFSPAGVWPATVSATDRCVAAFIPPSVFTGTCPNTCEHHQQMIRNLLGILTRKALNLNGRLEYLSICGVRQKLCTYLADLSRKQKSATIFLPLNRNETADFLNIPRPSLSRELCKMRDEGLIRFRKSSVEILDSDKIHQSIGL